MGGSPFYYASRNEIPVDDNSKTIEAMAKEYSSAYTGAEQYAIERAYTYGANDALGEILKIIKNPVTLSDGKSRNAGWLVGLPEIIEKKIEELRKESDI